MPRYVLRVSKNPKKDKFHSGNFNQMVDRVKSPTVNASIRLLRGANKQDGVLSSLFPASCKRVRNDSPSQHTKHPINKKNGMGPSDSDLPDYLDNHFPSKF